MKGLVPFASASAASYVVAVMEVFLILPAVGPGQMGVWQALLLAVSYLSVLRFGVLNGLNRELPYALGQGDAGGAQSMTATALSFTIGYAALGGLGFLAALPAFGGDSAWRQGLLAMSVVFSATAYSAFLESTFRGQAEFGRLARVKGNEALARAVSLPCVYLWGFTALCVRAAAIAVLVAFTLHWARPFRVRPRASWTELKRLMATGLPLAGSNALFTLAMGFERVILLSLGGVRAAGLYAPVSGVTSAISVLPNAVNLYAYPDLARRLGRAQDPAALRRPFLVFVGMSSAIGLLTLVAGWILLPLVFQRLFPEYLEALPAARIALVGGFLLSFRGALAPVVALKRWALLYGALGVFAVARYALPYLMVRQTSLLVGVSSGAALAALLLAVLSIAGGFSSTASPGRLGGRPDSSPEAGAGASPGQGDNPGPDEWR